MANSVDPDQTPQNVASDLGLHCLVRPIFMNRIYLIEDALEEPQSQNSLPMTRRQTNHVIQNTRHKERQSNQLPLPNKMVAMHEAAGWVVNRTDRTEHLIWVYTSSLGQSVRMLKVILFIGLYC